MRHFPQLFTASILSCFIPLTASAMSSGANNMDNVLNITQSSAIVSVAEKPEPKMENPSIFKAVSDFLSFDAMEIEKTPWDKDFESFEKSQKEYAAIKPQDSVLFLGSSSIRLWSSLRQDLSANDSLKHYTFINRGFGGSRLSDCAKYTNRLILEQKPKYVVVYAGDNDLAEGATPSEVKKSFLKTYQNIKTLSPQSKVIYVSIKPSPSRAHLIDKINKTNHMISQSVVQLNADAWNASVQTSKAPPQEVMYLDVYSLMLDDKGAPKPELFLADKLHMNQSGYAIWTTALTKVLK